jgi:hypothetical protein
MDIRCVSLLMDKLVQERLYEVFPHGLSNLLVYNGRTA